MTIKTSYQSPSYNGIKITKSLVTNSKVSFFVNNIPQDQSILSTIDKGGYDASINKIKIEKYIKVLSGSTSTEFIKLNDFVFSNSNDLKEYHSEGLVFKELNDKYEIIDLDIQHDTVYKFKLLIKNNKIDTYNFVNEIIISTEQKAFITSSNKIKILDYNFDFNEDINKANTLELKLKFEPQIDPNIKYYDNNYISKSLQKYCDDKYDSENDSPSCKSNIDKLNKECQMNEGSERDCKNMCCKFGLEDSLLIKSFVSPFKKSNTEYEIIIYNSSGGNIFREKIPFVETYIPILQLEPETNYKLTLQAFHNGYLELNSGIKITTSCVSKINQINFITPAINKNVCKVYKQIGSIVDKNNRSEDVSYYFDSNTKKCLIRQHNQLNSWCQNYKPERSKFVKYGQNYIYKNGKCEKKVDGKWIKQRNPDDSKCSTLCNGGIKKILQWNYEPPRNGGEHPLTIFPLEFKSKLKNDDTLVSLNNDFNILNKDDDDKKYND